MNGPEHYREAERYLQLAEQEMADAAKGGARHIEASIPLVTVALAGAQVHATLASAAAAVNRFSLNEGDAEAWSEVTQ